VRSDHLLSKECLPDRSSTLVGAWRTHLLVHCCVSQTFDVVEVYFPRRVNGGIVFSSVLREFLPLRTSCKWCSSVWSTRVDIATLVAISLVD